MTVNDFFMVEFSIKMRTKIHNAEKEGIKIEFDTIGSSLMEFYRLY
ncbi:MAG: hypothetical protein ACFFC3_14720 [Candidatus Odinarchaeota archaeon]